MNYNDLLKEIKGVFKPPRKEYYFGRVRYGTPIFYPRNYNSTILKFSIGKDKNNSNKYFNLFGLYIYYGTPIVIKNTHLMWKDKYSSPRHEFSPSFVIFFFGLQFVINYHSPLIDTYDDDYYEMILWYLYYSDRDINVAKKTWEVTSNGVSTWNDKYLINNRTDKLKNIIKDL